MGTAKDAQFWDRISRKYRNAAIADQAGYERTVDRSRALLNPGDHVLELGCGTGSTALRLAGGVQTYLATDLSSGMIAIAEEKLSVNPIPALSFQVGTAESSTLEAGRFSAVLGFNYLHMVRDVPATLSRIHTLLAPEGWFISKTPCLGDMNPLLSRCLLPAMRVIGQAPYVSSFGQAELCRFFRLAGFDIIAIENHATRGDSHRHWIVARKRFATEVSTPAGPKPP